MNNAIKCSGIIVGDIMIQRQLHSQFDFSQVIPGEIAKDFIIGNFETTVKSDLAYANLFPGGGYASVPANAVADLKRIGFNGLNIANNHTMDFAEDGLKSTMTTLAANMIPFCGAGENLAEAARPCYVEAPDCRLGMIGITSSFHDSYAAGPQNMEFRGRPGVNPLKHKAIYTLPEADFSQLLRIGENMGVNSYHNQARKEGYLTESDYDVFGSFNIKKGTTFSVETYPDKVDLGRLLSSVRDCCRQADITVVNIHSHQFKAGDKDCTPDFIEEASRKCIEAGATFVICTGPHVIRAIERYLDGAIFYGLGNFIFQHEQMASLPEEFYNKYGTTRALCDGVGEVMSLRSDGGKKGLFTQPKVWESFIVDFSCDRNRFKVDLHPIEIASGDCQAHRGLPKRSSNKNILQRVKKLSEEYHTDIMIDDNNVGHLEWTAS